MKIKEAFLVAPEKVEILESELNKKLTGDQLLIQVKSCGICSSEFPVFKGETMGKPGVSFRYKEYPVSLGHELAGVIVDKGPEATKFSIGDKVTGIGYQGSMFASHIIESESLMLKVPDSIEIESALGEPLMCVANIIRMSEIDFEDFVLVVGDGFMSLLTIAALSKYPLKELVVVGHHDYRLELAKKFGASHIINAKKDDPYWKVREIVDKEKHDPKQTPWYGGVDIAFEFAGNMKALQLCASLCKPKQRAKLMMPSAYSNEPFSIGEYLMNRGPSLIPCHPAHSRNVMDDLERAITALEQGIFPIQELITHSFALDEIEIAMNHAINKSDNYIKGIIKP